MATSAPPDAAPEPASHGASLPPTPPTPNSKQIAMLLQQSWGGRDVGREEERGWEIERERESVCVCVRERVCERERVCVCERERMAQSLYRAEAPSSLNESGSCKPLIHKRIWLM